jgi:hypothetical protein
VAWVIRQYDPGSLQPSDHQTPVPGNAPFLFRTTMEYSREMYPFISPCIVVSYTSLCRPISS